MIRTADLVAFLRSKGVTAGVNEHDHMVFPDMPDEAIALVPTGGPGTAVEREFDQATVQIRSRGKQNDPNSAQEVATVVDAAILSTPPFQIGGRHVADVDYLGGPPAFLRRDDALRDEIVCNYRIMIARD